MMGIVVSDATMASAMDALDAGATARPARRRRRDSSAIADDCGNSGLARDASSPLIAGASSHAETNVPTPIAAQSNGCVSRGSDPESANNDVPATYA